MFTAHRRPPNRKAATSARPWGLPSSGSMVGHFAAGRGEAASSGAPPGGRSRASSPGPSSRSGGRAARRSCPPTTRRRRRSARQLVKMQLACSVAMAFGLVFSEVPGATPKNPASGLIARSTPSAPGLIQAMSSPTVVIFQPSNPLGRDHHGEVGLAAGSRGTRRRRRSSRPSGSSAPRISMCSASQPSSRAITLAMRSAKHFLPSSALPP
jgi:hypothetical protein